MKKIRLHLVHLPGVKAHLEGGRRTPSRCNVLNAFTLVEIIVVMAIVAIVGTIMVVIFTNTLRGSNKSQILAAIKQNGQAVLENMDKTIRDADNVVCPDLSSNTLMVVQNGTYTRYRIVLSNNGAGTAPAECLDAPGVVKNGCIVQDHPTKQPNPADDNRLETDSVFIGSACNSSDPMPRAGSADIANILTDSNTQSGVSVENGLFTRNKSAGFSDQVTIRFDLKPGVQAPSVIASQIDPVTFQTTVQLR